MWVYFLTFLTLQTFTVSNGFKKQENVWDLAVDTNQLLTAQTFVQYIGRMMGFPRLRVGEREMSEPLFSGAEIRKMLMTGAIEKRELELGDENQCAHDLVRIISNAAEKWALYMLDSDGKLPAGILYGNLAWPGSYRECLASQAPTESIDNRTSVSFSGRYCTFSWNISGVLPVASGVCVPDTCQESDFENFTTIGYVLVGRDILQNSTFSHSLTSLISLNSISCQTKNPEYSSEAIAVLVIIFIFVFLVTTGTSLTIIEYIFSSASSSITPEIGSVINVGIDGDRHEYINDKEETADENADEDLVRLFPRRKRTKIISSIEDFFRCFCLITNGAKILDTSSNQSTDLRCIHGIRFISMTWVILGHTYAFSSAGNVVGNLYDVLKLMDNLLFQTIMQGTYAVDSFFVMSGFLLTYIFLREMNAREGKISWITFYLHRYWRLTPTYAMVLGFDTCLTWYLFSGPFQPAIYENGCKKTWWWNLLYINNFADTNDACMTWTWYLANDMQFYVISPIFLYALWKWPKVGLWIIATMFSGCWVSNFVLNYHYNINSDFGLIPPAEELPSFMEIIAREFQNIYMKPYTRIGPYLIGVLLAYFFTEMKERKKFLSVPIQITGWVVATGLGFFLVYGLYYAKLTLVEASFFNAFNRSCFAACLAWVIFACLTGHGEAVNKLLSYSAFVPLSRLTYCAYLIHPILMTLYILCLPQTLIVTHFQMVMLFFGFLVLSYGFAFVTSLLFESPAMAIERLLRQNSSTKRT